MPSHPLVRPHQKLPAKSIFSPCIKPKLPPSSPCPVGVPYPQGWGWRESPPLRAFQWLASHRAFATPRKNIFSPCTAPPDPLSSSCLVGVPWLHATTAGFRHRPTGLSIELRRLRRLLRERGGGSKPSPLFFKFAARWASPARKAGESAAPLTRTLRHKQRHNAAFRYRVPPGSFNKGAGGWSLSAPR